MSSVKITEFLNLHGEYVGVVIGTADGWTLPSTPLSSLSSLAKQTFPSREGLLVAIDDCLGAEVVAQMEQQRLQDEAEIRGRGGCLAITVKGRRCHAQGKYFDPELNGLNCGMHTEAPPGTIEEAQEWESAWQADGEAKQSAKMERQVQAHECARTALAEACTDRMLTQMVKEVTRLSQKRCLSPQVRKFLEQVITEDNYLVPGRSKHMHVLL
jgi:hypothetical protein